MRVTTQEYAGFKRILTSLPPVSKIYYGITSNDGNRFVTSCVAFCYDNAVVAFTTSTFSVAETSFLSDFPSAIDGGTSVSGSN